MLLSLLWEDQCDDLNLEGTKRTVVDVTKLLKNMKEMDSVPHLYELSISRIIENTYV